VNSAIESTFAGPFGGIRYEERHSHRASYTERRSALLSSASVADPDVALILKKARNGTVPARADA
jgi:hypothetical protein